MLLKNTAGKPDAILTMSVAAMVIVLLKVLLGGFSVTLEDTLVVDGVKTVISFGAIDGTVIGALLTPTLGAYVARRYTEQKFAVDMNNNGVIDPEEKVEEKEE